MLTPEDRAYYLAPGPFTRLDGFDITSLPDDVPSLVKIVQGVLIHRGWLKAYDVEIAPERLPEEGLHSIEAILARARMLRDAPITEPRPPADRVLANCRDFSTMLSAFLKLKGVPARARCGFARYFEPGKYVDHWVCEYWDEGTAHWRMVDAQLDALQVAAIKPDFDTLDVPERAFWVGGKSWQACRAGGADPDLFGIMHMWGLWYVRGNLSLDVASLNGIEMLPWDARIIAEQLAGDLDTEALFDRMASLSLRASDDARDVRDFYAGMPEVRISEQTLRAIADADAQGVGTGINPLAK
jgi:hypothetical protein